MTDPTELLCIYEKTLVGVMEENAKLKAALAQARRGAFEEAAAAVRGANGISEDQNWHYEMAARHIEALAVKSIPSVPTTAEPAAFGGANEVVACGVGTCRKPRSPNQEACSDCRACLYLIKVENLAADLKAAREEVARLRGVLETVAECDEEEAREIRAALEALNE